MVSERSPNLLPLSPPPPHAEALTTPETTLRWTDLLVLVDQRARELQKGLHERKRVLIHEQTSVRLIVELYALMQAGAVPVLAHPRWPRARAHRAFARVLCSGAPKEEEGCVVFTSGSSGEPKAVSLSRHALSFSAATSVEALAFTQGKRWLVSLPLCHVGGLLLLLRCMHGGGALALMGVGERLPAAVERARPTHLSVVTAQLNELMAAIKSGSVSQAAQSALQEIVVGGGPVPQGVVEHAASLGLPLRQTWGMSETAAMVTLSEKGDAQHCGRVLPGVGGSQDVIQVNASGELLVKGPSLFSGYLCERGGLDLPLNADGFFLSGDLAQYDNQGNIKIIGRVDERFISGGENIDPSEVEAELLRDPRVIEAVVVPKPCERFGQRPVAFVRLVEDVDQRETLVELKKQGEARLPSYMRPIAYRLLPRDGGLKPSRKALRQRALTLDVEEPTLRQRASDVT